MLAKTSLLLVSVIVGVGLSTTASAKRFCYYWVDDAGTADTFETPPLDLTSPPFPATEQLNGHLVVALTKDSCRRSVLRSKVRRPAGKNASRTPVNQPGAEIGPGVDPEEAPSDPPSPTN